MKKLLLSISLLMCWLGLDAQKTNIAPLATVTASSCNTGPCSALNDLNLGTCGTQSMWISTSSPPSTTVGTDFIEWNWPTPQSFDEILIHHAQSNAARQLQGATMQSWNGSAWVTTGTFSGLPASCTNTISFQRVTTNRFRFTLFQMNGPGQTSNPNFREIEIFQASTSPDDAGVSQVNPLVAVCPATIPVEVVVNNYGTNAIDSVQVHWDVNGVLQTPVMYNAMTLDTIGGAGQSSDTVVVGTFSFLTNTNYVVRAWTSLPNNNIDTSTFNDSASAVLRLGAPSGLAIGGITATSATAFWNAFPSTNYEVIFGPAGFNPQFAGNSVLSSGSSANMLSLLPNTLYDVYLVADCGTAYSDTAGPVSFFTPCVTFTAPFFEDFDSTNQGWVASGNNANNGISQCWTSFPPVSNGSEPFKWIPRSTGPTSGNGPLMDKTGGNFMYCEASGSSAGDTALLTTPPIDVSGLTTPALYFYQHRYSGASIADMEIEVTNDGTLTWSSVYSVTGDIQTSSSDPWMLEFVNLAAYTGDTIQIRFRQKGNGCCGDAAIDDIIVDEAPTCPWPGGLTVTSVTDSNAIAAWSDPSGTKWDLFWGPSGFQQGSPGTFSMTTTTNPDTLGGLLPNTLYDYYVRANCIDSANGVSLLIGPFTFRTPCLPFTAPYSDNFDSSPNNAIPFCWANNITGGRTTNGVAQTYQFGTPNTSPNHIRFYNGNPAGPGDTTLFISPQFSDLTAGNKRIQFMANGTTTLTNELVIGTMGNPLDILSFNPIDTVPLTSSYQLYVVNVNLAAGYNGTDKYVAFRHGNSSTFRTIYLDDFVYETIPLCNPPLSNTLGAFDITATGASVYWGAGSDGNETHVEWGPTGYTPGGIGALGSDSTAGSNDTLVLTGLTAQTTYDVYIRDSCAANGFSPWVGPITFTTKCVLTQAATLPFIDGFESYATGPYFEDQDFCFPSYYWDFQADDPTGRLRLQGGANFYKSGQQAFTLDHTPAPSLPEDNFLTLAINLSNYTTSNGIELNFSYLSHGQEASPSNRVWVRGSGTDPWIEIYDLDVTQGQNGTYFDVTNVDIVGPLAAASQAVGANTQIRFGQTGRFTAFSTTFSDGFSFDDVSLVEVTCPTPTGLNATNLVDTGATLTWNGSTSASGYQVWFGPNGFYQGTATLGGTKRFTTTPTLVLDTLRSKVCYEYVVRYICGPGDTSFYAGPYDYCTPCSIFNAPVIETFDSPNWTASGNNAGNVLDGCWSSTPDVSNGLEPFKWIPRSTGPTSGNGPLSDNTGGNFLYCEASGSSANDVATLISPQIDLGTLANPSLFFDQHRYGAGNIADMDVDISTDFGSTWTNLYNVTGDIQTSAAAPWVTQSANLVSYAGDTIMIRFVQTGNGCCGDAAIDNFIIRDVVSEDMAVIDADFVRKGLCLGTNDTIRIDVANNIGSAVNFATTNLMVHYDVTGPVNTSGTITVNTGTLPAGDTTSFLATNIDMSQPGFYTLNAYIDPNTKNLDPSNDTLLSAVTLQVYDDWEVTPDTVVVITNMIDTVELEAKSPFFSGGEFKITEICQFKSTGTPVGGWPSYLTADDYMEITGVPNSDLGGLTLEIWNSTSLVVNYTFPQGTLLSPNGTAIIMTGQGAVASQPANFLYDGRGTSTTTWSSGTVSGYILKSGTQIVDAVGYNGHTFSAASGVTAADWSGNVPSGSGTAGIRLVAPDANLAANYSVVSSALPQDPNVLNAGVPQPAAGSTAGFAWTLNSAIVDTLPKTVVGPYTTSGVYNYIATFNGPCGVFSDTVTVIVNLPGSCPTPTNLAAQVIACDSVEISWNTAADSALVAYVATGGTPGTGTLVVGDSSLTITGTMANTTYDYYVTNICKGDTGNVAGPFTFNTGNVGAPVAVCAVNQQGFTLLVSFDASTSMGKGNSYAWDFGDGNTGTGANTTHTYASGGAKTITLVVTNACGSDTTTCTLPANFSYGENTLAQSLVLFPNPAKDQVKVSFDAEATEMTLRVLDLSGKEIMTEEHDNLNGKVDFMINVGQLADGVYMIEVSNGELKATKRLIKQ